VTARPTAVVVGASLAGLSTVRALRDQGFDGRVVLLGAEPDPPYDRPPLSKGYLTGVDSREKIELTDAAELDRLEVEPRFNTRATGLRPADRAVLIGDDELVADLVVLATGSRPRSLPALGARPGVHQLRDLADAESLRAALQPGTRLVVIGAGFIGSEVASSARTLDVDVTVVELLDVPLSVPLGAQIGAICASLHAANGVDLRTGVGVKALAGKDCVTGVELTDSSVVEADVVLAAVGAMPVTEWLSGSGLAIDNGVLTDAAGLTSVPGVAAVGDIARVAGPWTVEPTRVEHWTNALEGPARAVAALLNGPVDVPAARAPYFWSDQYGVTIQFAGHREPADVVRMVEGDAESGSFVAVYENGDQPSAVVAVNASRTFTQLRRQLVARHTEVIA
jgi:3-phenylpropionate/trans-cinnamate dioxygenase ferredoxin reductase component